MISNRDLNFAVLPPLEEVFTPTPIEEVVIHRAPGINAHTGLESSKLQTNPEVSRPGIPAEFQQQSCMKEAVIDPGFALAAPIHGPPRTNPLYSGLSPVVFANQISATDILALYQQNILLRNHLLARTAVESNDLQRLLGQKDVAIVSDGCPLCGYSRWQHMTAGERRNHLDQHYQGKCCMYSLKYLSVKMGYDCNNA